jgi:hypothetical protein
MSNLSRRSLVTSAAALPALAVPAVAIAAIADPDPIHAAIKRWKEAVAVELAGFDARDTALTAFKDRYGSLTPCGLPKGTIEIFESGGVRNAAWRLRTHQQITELKSHPDWRPLVPFLHRTLNIQTEDYEKNVAPIEEAADTATDKRIEATYAVFDTVPTTLAGMRAKIDFADSVDHITETLQQAHDPERLKDFLETLYECAAHLAA